MLSMARVNAPPGGRGEDRAGASMLSRGQSRCSAWPASTLRPGGRREDRPGSRCGWCRKPRREARRGSSGRQGVVSHAAVTVAWLTGKTKVFLFVTTAATVGDDVLDCGRRFVQLLAAPATPGPHAEHGPSNASFPPGTAREVVARVVTHWPPPRLPEGGVQRLRAYR